MFKLKLEYGFNLKQIYISGIAQIAKNKTTSNIMLYLLYNKKMNRQYSRNQYKIKSNPH
jgi:hypothetical protein